MRSVFVSYARVDGDIAGRLSGALDDAGFVARWDVSERTGPKPGQDWAKWISRSISNSAAMVAVCSKASASSAWCTAELALAHEAGIPIVPVRLGADAALPSTLSLAQAITLDGDRSLSDAVDELLNSPTLRDGGSGRRFEVRRSTYDPERPPFPGLFALQQSDNPVFFGRDDEVERLVGVVQGWSTGPVVVHGPSGAGKSSLLLAGVLPVLEDEGWSTDELKADDLTPQLIDGVVAHPPDGGADVAKRCLFVDQAERALATVSPGFAALRLLALRCQQRGVRLVLAVRSEYFDELCRDLDNPASPIPGDGSEGGAGPAVVDLPSEHETLRTRDVYVRHLDRASIAEIIRGPARVANLRVPAAVVDRLVAETPVGTALPLLAYALRELWNNLSTDDELQLEQDFGSVEGVLLRQARLALADAAESDDEHKQAPVLRTIARLADVSEETPRLRPTPIGRFDATEQRWLSEFEKRRLLTKRRRRTTASVEDTESVVIDVAHERLFVAWPELRDVITTTRRAIADRQAIDDAFTRWSDSKKDRRLLLKGPLLAAAIEMEGALGEAETSAFVRESQRRDRSEVRAQRALRAAALLGLVAVIAAVSTFALWRLTVGLQAETEALRQAASARAAIDSRRDDALLGTVAAYQRSPQDETADALLSALLAPRGPVQYFNGSMNWIELAALNEHEALVPSNRGRLHRLDLRSGEIGGEVGLPDTLFVSELAVDDGLIAVGGWREGGAELRVIDAASEEATALTLTDPPRQLALNDGLLAWGDLGGALWVAEINAEGRIGEPQRIARHENSATSVAIADGGELVASGSISQVTVVRREGASWSIPESVASNGLRPTEVVAFRPATEELFVGGAGSTVWRRDFGGSAPPEDVTTTEISTTQIGFSRDGATMVLADGRARALQVHDTDTGVRTGSPLIGHRQEVNGLSWVAPDLVLSGDEAQAILWDLGASRALPGPGLPVPLDLVTAVAGQAEGIVAARGNELETFEDGRRVSLYTHGAAITRVWLSRAGAVVLDERGDAWLVGADPPEALARSPWAVTASACVVAVGSELTVDFDAPEGCGGPVPRPLSLPSTAGSEDSPILPQALALGRDGKIAVGYRNGRVEVYDLGGGGPVATSDGGLQVTGLAFATSSELLIGRDRGQPLEVWDLASGERRALDGHDDVVDQIAVSENLDLIATGGEDGTVHLWRRSTLTRLGPGFEPVARRIENDSAARIRSLAFDEQGEQLIVVNASGATTWDVAPARWERTACAAALGVSDCPE